MTNEEMKVARKAFSVARNQTLRKGVQFDLTFEQWLSVWEDSGLWRARGHGEGKFAMGRIDLREGFAVGNVHIQPSNLVCGRRPARAKKKEVVTIVPVRDRLTNANTTGTLTKLFNEPARPGSMDFKNWPSLGACGGRQGHKEKSRLCLSWTEDINDRDKQNPH